MSKRFGRAIELRIGGLEISNLDSGTEITDLLGVAFNIKRTLNREPNKGTITILNLSKDSRSKLAVEGKLPVTLRAGHLNDKASLIYQGDVRFSNIVNDGVQWITSFETGDGSRTYKTARINKSLKNPTTGDLLRECGRVLEANGIGLGNLQSKIDEGGVVPTLIDFFGGVVLSGKVVDVMTQVCTSLGYEWSIQDEQIQILRPDEKLSSSPAQILVVSPSTGLIGSPQLGKKSLVNFRMLVDGRARPGKTIRLESDQFPSGDLRVERVNHIGDTWGNDWYSDIEAKEPRAA